MLKFNSERMLSLLKDFYNLTGIKICIYDEDFNEIIFYPKRLCGFCELIQATPRGREKCLSSDRFAMGRAKENKSTFMYQCHMGLTEAVTPIFYNEIIIGYIMLGQVAQSEGETTGNAVLAAAESYGADYQALLRAYSAINIIDAEKLLSACHILETCASYLYMKKQIGITEGSIIAEIDEYINKNIQSPITVDKLCSNFLLSRSELYQIFKQYYASTVADYIRNKRLNIAKNLLLTTDLSIKKIAAKCGIDDYNYLSKVFKKATGMSPKDFRKDK